MKIIKLLIISTLTLFNLVLNAQDNIQITESERSISGLSGNALTVELDRVKKGKILEEWEDLMKNYNGETDIHDNQIHSRQVTIESINSEKIEVAGSVEKVSENKNSFSAIFFSNEKAISSESAPAGFVAAKSIMQKFAYRLSTEAIERYKESQIELLDNLSDKLKDLNDEKENLSDEIEDLTKDIEAAKEKIESAKEKIEENKKKGKKLAKEVDAVKEKIESQEKVVEKANQEKKLYK